MPHAVAIRRTAAVRCVDDRALNSRTDAPASVAPDLPLPPTVRHRRLVVLANCICADCGRRGSGREVDAADGAKPTAERRAAGFLAATRSEIAGWWPSIRSNTNKLFDGWDLAAGRGTSHPRGGFIRSRA